MAIAAIDRDLAGDAPDPPGHLPERRCLATGEIKPIAALLRFAVWPTATGAGEIVPDVDRRLGGRGLWITARRDIVVRAAARNLFAKAARADVRVPAGLAERVEELLLRRVVSGIGLARRAGAAVQGREQVRTWLTRGRVGVLLTAGDCKDGRRDGFTARERDMPEVTVLTGAELGLAFGREWVVQAALAAGRLAREVHEEAGRLAGMRVTGHDAADGRGDGVGSDE